MQDGLLDRYYSELPNQDRAYDYAARYVDLAAHKWPEMKILEVGGGTGSATSFILKLSVVRKTIYSVARLTFSPTYLPGFSKKPERNSPPGTPF